MSRFQEIATRKIEQVSDLLLRRKKRVAELAAKRNAIAEAERAISLCDIAEKKIPTLLANLRASTTTPHFSEGPGDEVLRNVVDLSAMVETDATLSRLLAELPAIRAHWQERSKELLAA